MWCVGGGGGLTDLGEVDSGEGTDGRRYLSHKPGQPGGV